MSLQVWLPLNGNTKNHGLCGDTLESSGVTFADGGKIGAKYLSAGTITIPAAISGTFFNKTGMSFAFWLYPIGDSSTGIIMGQISMAAGDNRMYSIFQYSTPNNLHLSWQDETSSNTFCSGSWSNFFPANAWTHCCITYNGSIIKIYRNGILYTTVDAVSKRNSFNYNFPIWGNAIRKLNDVRIYDHCLSAKEVKIISQGLVLHYPLNDRYIESTTNLITSEDCLSSTCFNGATQKYSYGTTTDMYKTVTTYDGKKGTKVYMGTNGNPAFPYVYISNLYTSNGTNAPEYKTLSFDYFSTISTALIVYKLGNGSGTGTYKVINSTVSTGTATNTIIIPVEKNTWNHIELTLHGTTDANAEWGYIQNSPSHTSNTSNFWFYANMQLETKDHATPYVGPGGSRNETIIYDTSGYCNNGIKTNNLSISEDTARYNCSTYMSTASLITHPRPISGGIDQEWTTMAWVKLDNLIENQKLNDFNHGNFLTTGTYALLYLNSSVDDYYNYANTKLTAETWTHVAFVFKNSEGIKKIYFNGIDKTNNGGPNKTSTPKGINNTVTIGTNFSGYINDYRIYATALSAEDIAELYSVGASIDNQGNVYSAMIQEV